MGAPEGTVSSTGISSPPQLIVGIDIGGTFTDVVSLNRVTGELVTSKVSTTPADLRDGIRAGIGELGDPSGVAEIHHGTTVVTNALLQGRVAKTALLCTRGFRDVLEMRRLWREKLFGYDWQRPAPIIPRHLRIEISERIGPDGSVLTPLAEDEVRRAAASLRGHGVEAVAVAFLFSFRNPAHEKRVAAILADELPAVPVSISSEVLPEIHEYERTSTTVINSQVRPEISRYLDGVIGTLKELGVAGPLRMVRSDGSLISPAIASAEPIRLVHSGPAVGVTGAARIGGWLGWKNVVTLDMGGTSTDVSLIWDGAPLRVLQADIKWDTPVRATQIDIQSIGAGGGSIVGLDEGGRIRVGPESAGADPGPVCYGRGGSRATVTDALLVLGALPDALLGGQLRLHRAAAEEALREALPGFPDARQAAAAVYTVTLQKMAVLTREVTVNRGYDPRDCTLMCFGGAGGLFAVDLARELDIARVYLPPAASVFSAVGAALARVSYEAIDGIYLGLEKLSWGSLRPRIDELSKRVRAFLAADGMQEEAILVEGDFKYRSQPETLSVPLDHGDGGLDPLTSAVREFHRSHSRRFGMDRHDEAVDLVTLRVTVLGPMFDHPSLSMRRDRAMASDGESHARTWFRDGESLSDVPVVHLEGIESLRGPAFLEDAYTTIAVPPRTIARRDRLGGILLEIG